MIRSITVHYIKQAARFSEVTVQFGFSPRIYHALTSRTLTQHHRTFVTTIHQNSRHLILQNKGYPSMIFQGVSCRRMLSTTPDQNTHENQSQKNNDSHSQEGYVNHYYNEIVKKYELYEKESKQFRDDIQFIVEQFEKKKYDTRKLKHVSLLVVVLIVFMFWRTIKSFVSKETSDVAIKTINDDDVRKNLYTLLSKVLEDAKSDPVIAQQLATLVKSGLSEALQDKETMEVLQKIVSEVVSSEKIKQDVEKLTNEVVSSQLRDEQNKKLLTDVLYESLCGAYERVKSSIKFW